MSAGVSASSTMSVVEFRLVDFSSGFQVARLTLAIKF